MSTLATLKSLRNKPHLYLGNRLIIHDYEMDEENMYLKVDRNGQRTELMIPNTEAKTFFDDLLPVEEGRPVNQQVTIYSNQQNQLATLRQKLMELNDKLSGPDGEKYIKQAKAINNNINTLLNSVKLELMVQRELTKNQ